MVVSYPVVVSPLVIMLIGIECVWRPADGESLCVCGNYEYG